MKQIVVATDGSASAREAVEVALDLADEHGAEITFVHVLPADDFAIAGRGAPVMPRPHAVEMDESEDALADAANAAEAAGVSYTLERISGDVLDEVVAVADVKDADLVVVGSRGRGTLASALLGSVSRGLLSNGKHAVLVVRAARTAEVTV
jgi:nucleotide-binding universal stress UspA family protein